MTHLEGIRADALREALDDVDDSRASRRLIAGIAYKHGVAQTELAEWFDVERKTVYNWLSRFDGQPDDLVDAAHDDHRPGRPTKLTPEQRNELASILELLPEEAGYDVPGWDPPTVHDLVRDEFGVVYSLPSCHRLLAELGGGKERRSLVSCDRTQ